MRILLAVIVVVLYVGLPDLTHAQLPGIPLDCPVGWKKNFRNNMCYWFNNNDFVPQYKAGQKCGNRGGHLVKIDDADENKFIADNYEINPNNTVQSEYAWIGLSEQWEGKWVWEHDRSDLDWANWAAGQPDDDKGEDYAATRAKTGEWYDMRSNKDYGYICEKEIVPDTTPKPPRTIRPTPATTPQPPPKPTTQPPPPPSTNQPPPPPSTNQPPPPSTNQPPPSTNHPPPPPSTNQPPPPQSTNQPPPPPSTNQPPPPPSTNQPPPPPSTNQPPPPPTT